MTMRRWCRSLLALCLVSCLGATRAAADPPRAEGPTPPRLAFIDGEVSFWRPGADDWAPADVNTALSAGDQLYVADRGNVEVEIGARAWVRCGSSSQLVLSSLETGFLQLEVTSGHCALDLKRVPEGQVIELDTPNAAFTIERPGYYRADVNDATVFTTRRGGVATVIPAGAESEDVGTDARVVLEGTETATIRREPAPDVDDWDRWNYDRTGHLAERPRSAEYVAAPIAGVDDLDRYGEWRPTPRYGNVWVPRDLPPDWAPYSTGRWVYDPYYEWTWVDDQPWGWAPYHYGRWCYVDGYWGWAPGPIVARPVYAPALVAFFDAGGVAVSVGAGTPFVSWVALGWGEPVIPWWGPPALHGRPYWGGWGGPRVVNNTVINNTTIVNVNTINRFSNTEVRNALVGVPREGFGRHDVQPVRFGRDQARELQPVRGAPSVKPVAASLVPRTGHAARPPEQIQNRRVVATRRPQDPAPRLRAAGIEPRQPRPAPEPRIVQPRGRGGAERGGAERGGAEHGGVQQAPGAERGGGRHEGERMTPPPPPGSEQRGVEERGRRGREQGGPGGAEVREPGGRGRERGPGAERGVEERGQGRERGGEAVPPPPPGAERGRRGERGPREGGVTAPEGGGARERGGRNEERGRENAPPPPGRHENVAPSAPGERPENVERGGRREHEQREPRPQREAPPRRQMAPPPEQGGGRGGRDVERGRPEPPPDVRTNERGGGGGGGRHERAPETAPEPRRMERPAPEPRQERPPPEPRSRQMERPAPEPRRMERTAPEQPRMERQPPEPNRGRQERAQPPPQPPQPRQPSAHGRQPNDREHDKNKHE